MKLSENSLKKLQDFGIYCADSESAELYLPYLNGSDLKWI